MKRKLSTYLAVFGLVLQYAQAFAQAPDFTGTWILNLEKSKLESHPAGLTGSVFLIQQEGNTFRLTRYHQFGERDNKISFKMEADGRERRAKLLFKSKLEKTKNGLQSTLWRKNFLNVVNYKFA